MKGWQTGFGQMLPFENPCLTRLEINYILVPDLYIYSMFLEFFHNMPSKLAKTADSD